MTTKTKATSRILDAVHETARDLHTLENTDLETVALSTDPEFLDLIQSSRDRHSREGGLSSAEIRRRLEAELQD